MPVSVLAADAELTADDRLHAGVPGGKREFESAEEIAAVGDGNRRHAVLGAELYEILRPDRALAQREGGVDPKMDEIGMRHGDRIPRGRSFRKTDGIVLLDERLTGWLRSEEHTSELQSLMR